ncbi:hypothetical protein [Halomarina ordinaria]|uniref:Uncharacterized protein n=1 Tax=Halomarina ordinaria TaxID=3033939 RepID=A0ABD5U8N8_9EURY|nr:hypothetical protein [Halomarina sp. PSRA2]
MNTRTVYTLVSLGLVLTVATSIAFLGGWDAADETPLPDGDGDRTGSIGTLAVDDSGLTERGTTPLSDRHGGRDGPDDARGPDAAEGPSAAGGGDSPDRDSPEGEHSHTDGDAGRRDGRSAGVEATG